MRTWWMIALWALSGCSLAHDFDKPFPAANVEDQCAILCEAAADCFELLAGAGDIEDCKYAGMPADRALFTGRCEQKCRANPAAFDQACDNGGNRYLGFWRDNLSDGYEALCAADEALCDAACAMGLGQTPLAEWSGKVLYNEPVRCRAACEDTELDRWRCVGRRLQLSGGLVGEHAPLCPESR